MSYIFQYGSNCSEPRLNGKDRLDGAAEDLGVATTINQHELVFDIWSQGNGCAALDLLPGNNRVITGVLYEIPEGFVAGSRADKKKTLAMIEGPRYERTSISVNHSSLGIIQATTYVGKSTERREGVCPNALYVSWIVSGLREHGVPEDYVGYILDTALSACSSAKTHTDGESARIEMLRQK